MFDFTSLRQAITSTTEHLRSEFAAIRTGRAAPAILDTIRVDAYGSMMPLQQVGSVTVEDARTLRVAAWDQAQVKAIERAIMDADLGVSVSADERGVRVSFPELTSERREQLTRLTKTKLEDARTAVRRARDEAWQAIQLAEREKTLSEDDKFRAKEQMESIVKDANETFDGMARSKEQELSA